MSKQTYFLMDEENVHEYTLTVKVKDNGDTVYTLKTSKGGEWSSHFKDTKLVKAIDTGNGIKVKPYEFDFDDLGESYCGFHYLSLLLGAIHNINNHISGEYKLLKVEEV
jgi:hypothetical protein